jgi:hypothetical protein
MGRVTITSSAVSRAKHQGLANRPEGSGYVPRQGVVEGAKRVSDEQPTALDDQASGGLAGRSQAHAHVPAIDGVALELDQPAVLESAEQAAGRRSGDADALADAFDVGGRLLLADDGQDPPLGEGQVLDLPVERSRRERDAPEDDPFDRVNNALVSVHRVSDRLDLIACAMAINVV